MRRLLIALTAATAGIGGNIIAGFLVQDVFQNIFSPERVAATIACLALVLFLGVYLESSVNSVWSWRWHRFWYLTDLARTIATWQPSRSYAELHLAQRQRPIFSPEVMRADKRWSLIEIYMEAAKRNGQHGQKILVVGEPGSGKTTSLERFAWLLTSPLHIRLFSNYPIPVIVRLNRFQDGDFEPFVTQSLKGSTQGWSGAVLAEHFAQLTRQGRLLFLCDAMDEALGVKERRDKVLSQIAEFCEIPANRNTVIIITSRTREEPGFKELNLYEIQDLSDDSVREFISLYKREQDDTDDIVAQLHRYGLLDPAALGRNPFWLRMLVESGTFSGDRSQIIDEAVSNLLRRSLEEGVFVYKLLARELVERRTAGPSRPLLDVTNPEAFNEARRAIAWLAYKMSLKGLTVISADDAVDELYQWIAQSSNLAGWSPGNLIALGQDASILDYRAYTHVQFRHRLLQEALTAWALRSEPISRKHWQSEVDDHVGDTTWWQTILLLNETQSDSTALVEAVMQKPTDLRITLAAVLANNAKEVREDLAARVHTALMNSLMNGISDEHRRAFIALQGLNVQWLVTMLTRTLSRADSKSSGFVNMVYLVTELDSRTTNILLAALDGVSRMRLLIAMEPSIAAKVLQDTDSETIIAFFEEATPWEGSVVVVAMPEEKQLDVMTGLTPQTQASILSYLEPQQGAKILRLMTPLQVAAIITEVPSTGG